jgi:hypothetical protein
MKALEGIMMLSAVQKYATAKTQPSKKNSRFNVCPPQIYLAISRLVENLVKVNRIYVLYQANVKTSGD